MQPSSHARNGVGQGGAASRRPTITIAWAAAWLIAAPACFAVSNLDVSPSSVMAGAITNVVVAADLAAAGNAVEIEVAIDPDGDGIVDPSDWTRYRYTVTDGVGADCPNVVADDDGAVNGAVSCRVHLTGIPAVAGPYTVRATDEDASTATASFEVVQPATAQWITGRIVNGSGVPVPGAVAYAQDPAEEDSAFVITDASGEFTAYLGSTGPHFVVAVMPGMLSSFEESAEMLDLAPGANPTSGDLVVRDGHPTLSGEVRVGISPVPGILVVLSGQGAGDEEEYLSISVSDSAGAFTTTVAEGAWEIEVSVTDAQAHGLAAPGGRMIAVGSNDVSGVTIELAAADATISGRLVNAATAAPVPGVEIEAEDGAWKAGWATGANGEFCLAVPGGAWTLEVFAEGLNPLGLVPPPSTNVNVAAGGSVTNIVLEAKPGRRIEGTVRSAATLQPIEGIRFAAIDADTGWWTSGERESDADGRYSLLVAQDADHWVYALGDPPDYLYQYYDGVYTQAEATRIAAGTSTVHDTDFLLIEPSILQGTVRADDGGAPLAGVDVTAYAALSGQWLQGQRTDGLGQYALSVPPTQVVMQAHATGYGPQYWDHVETWESATRIDTASTGQVWGIDFDLAGAGWIRGKVRSAVGMTPLAGVPVSVFDHGTGESLASAATDGGGVFVAEVGPGARSVWIHGPAGWIGEWYDDHAEYESDWQTADTVTVASGATNDMGAIYLDEGAVIAGTVDAAAPGNPLGGAEVRAAATGGGPQPGGGGWTASDGSYAVTVPTNREYLVWAVAEGYARVIYDGTFDWGAASVVDLRSSNRVEGVDFVLPAGNWVRGLVRDYETALPIEGASVIASPVPAGPDAPTEWTRPDGSYDCSLPSGTYRVRAGCPGYLTAYYAGAYLPADAADVIVSSTSSPDGIDFELVPSSGDTDGDGMPNAWEGSEGLDPTVRDADDDPDHDGAPSGDEYAADTRPRDRTSVFQAVIAPGSVVVRWSVMPGRTYRLLSASAPTGAWVERHVEAASAEGWLEWADPTAGGADRQFYEVAVDPK